MRSAGVQVPTAAHACDKRRTRPAAYRFVPCNNAIDIKVWYIVVVIPGHRLEGASMPRSLQRPVFLCHLVSSMCNE